MMVGVKGMLHDKTFPGETQYTRTHKHTHTHGSPKGASDLFFLFF